MKIIGLWLRLPRKLIIVGKLGFLDISIHSRKYQAMSITLLILREAVYLKIKWFTPLSLKKQIFSEVIPRWETDSGQEKCKASIKKRCFVRSKTKTMLAIKKLKKQPLKMIGITLNSLFSQNLEIEMNFSQLIFLTNFDNYYID